MSADLGLEQRRRGLRADGIDHRLGHVQVAGDQVAALGDAVATGEIAVAAARLTHQQYAGIKLADWLLEDGAWEVQASGHHMGTTRLGDDPHSSVVDRHCQVHEIGNLHIAGPSVFPTSGWAGPMLTAIALALRLADRLKQRLA